VSRRTEQLASVLQRAVQSVIERGLSDPRIDGVITVTHVRVTPDLKVATFSVVVMPQEHEALTLHGLKSAARHIRRRTGELVSLARLPEYRFCVDDSYKREIQTLEAIHRAVESLDSGGDAPADDAGAVTPEPPPSAPIGENSP